MTKERRLAIEMWEQIAEHLEEPGFDVHAFKDRFCREHNLHWEFQCWFCQYARKEYRANLPSRQTVNVRNGCQQCPIYKYEKCEGDVCGCNTWTDTLYARVESNHASMKERIEAAKTIARLLKEGK